MIDTYFGTNALSTPAAFVAALFIGAFFGFALERAGFGSSRKLAGIFYFRDMTVLKVMFTAVITAMLGLAYALGFGWLRPEQIYFLPTQYTAQILGGLLFGIGFVMGGWCPGTAAVGLASGKKDALIFLGGATLGSMLFNELYPLMKGITTGGDVLFVWDSLGISKASFALAFTLIAVAAFWASEWAERQVAGTGPYWNTTFLKAFSVILVLFAVGLFAFGDGAARVAPVPMAVPAAASEQALLETIETARDHMDAAVLADRLMAGDGNLVLVDVRPESEYRRFHIRGAIRASLPDLPAALQAWRDREIVLYSNGMTHPAQARDVLARLGWTRVFLLTDGLTGFVEGCLKPVSLRHHPLSPEEAARVRRWRSYFVEGKDPAAKTGVDVPTMGGDGLPPAGRPGRIDGAWLQGQLENPRLRIWDLRKQNAYSLSHIPGSLRLDPEHLRGTVGGIGSQLLPAPMLAAQFGLLGLQPEDRVVLVTDDRPWDATYVGMALRRVGHDDWLLLDGGIEGWKAEKRPLTTALPKVEASSYPLTKASEDFVVAGAELARELAAGKVQVLDARPADTFTGEKIEEARGGHVPGALSRPYTLDQTAGPQGSMMLADTKTLAATYGALLPDRDRPVVVMCRTGHQASQTFFILKDLLGYRHLRWYDGGWTEWSARPEFPVEIGGAQTR